MLWERIAEHKIRAALAEGLFEELPGAGKPLRWEDDSLVPPAWRAAFHLLSRSGLAPAWILLDGEIRRDQQAARLAFSTAVAQLDDQGPGYGRAVDQFTQRVAEINRAIDNLNLQVPSPRLTRTHLQIDLEIAGIIRTIRGT
jgi:hypothetical protein